MPSHLYLVELLRRKTVSFCYFAIFVIFYTIDRIFILRSFIAKLFDPYVHSHYGYLKSVLLYIEFMITCYEICPVNNAIILGQFITLIWQFINLCRFSRPVWSRVSYMIATSYFCSVIITITNNFTVDVTHIGICHTTHKLLTPFLYWTSCRRS